MNPGTTLVKLKSWLGARAFLAALDDPLAAQRRVLETILHRNRDTAYGRKHRFGQIHNLRDYQQQVPVVNYEDIRPWIERATHGEARVLTSEPPEMFARTSGTTGEPKYIPVTRTCRRQGGMSAWLYFARRDHPAMLQGKWITIVSPAVEGHTPAGIPYGSTSGMVVRELPAVVQRNYAVPYEVYEIHDYTAQYYTLLRFGLAEDVSFLGAANPSSVLMLAEMADRFAESLIHDIHDGTLNPDLTIDPALRAALEPKLNQNPARAQQLQSLRHARRGRLIPRDYWPHLALLGCWKGGTVGSYIERFPDWFDPAGEGLAVRDMGYLASEARMSIPVSDHGAGGVLATYCNVFEFVPLDDVVNHPDDPRKWTCLGVDDVQTGREYHVIVTTTGGLYRYDMNDIVEIAGRWRQTPIIEFRRKGRGMTNLTGEKLCVNHLVDAVKRAGDASGTEAAHFKAEPDARGSRYVFKVEIDPPPDEPTARRFLAALDHALGHCNIEWHAKRQSGRLRDPLLQVMRPGWYERAKQQHVADGGRLFQSKTILLDAHDGYHHEPDETQLEVAMHPVIA